MFICKLCKKLLVLESLKEKPYRNNMKEMAGIKIVDLFNDDPLRNKKFSRRINIGDEFLYFDFSKTHFSAMLLYEMKNNFEEYYKIQKMFEKEKINFTEHRKVLHVALRNRHMLDVLEGTGNEEELSAEERLVFMELKKMREFEKKFRDGKLKGATGKVLRTIVNIGIGGSDLGPRVVSEALEYYKKNDVSVFFIANIDPTETTQVFSKINAEETLFVVVSKTFTTLETLANATLALKLMSNRLGVSESEIAEKHFVGVSANKQEVEKFGITNNFDMWDFVGGRFSLWSAVGLSIMLYIGFENFLSLLRGASVMDEHFRTEEVEKNVPILQALIEIYYCNIRKYNNKCIVAYDEYLKNIHLYLQQAEMESNGKSATTKGPTSWDTGMIIWGGVGTSVQHSFFQLLHQGTQKVLVEFILPLQPLKDHKVCKHSHFEMLFANCLAQSQALMVGSSSPDIYRAFEGDRPSITICFSKLTPAILGALIAFYEHKIFVQGLYWKINSFDQFGVELGKRLAGEILNHMENNTFPANDSTKSLIELFKSVKKDQ